MPLNPEYLLKGKKVKNVFAPLSLKTLFFVFNS
jgi:hypothetical protein